MELKYYLERATIYWDTYEFRIFLFSFPIYELKRELWYKTDELCRKL